MKILVIGGTVFVGRHFVAAALARGHDVTLFNRGAHSPDLFPDVEKLRGDRDGGLDVLRGRRWDAVLDTCGYGPRVVGQSADLLAPSVGHYTFISSISVYGDFSRLPMDETAPLAAMPEGADLETVTNESYGPLKVLCEQAVMRAFPERSLIVRPGMIVGPDDPSDRFTYWPARVKGGGEILVPGNPSQKMQIIDVRDLAAWTLAQMEAGAQGDFNVTGPDHPLTMQKVLETSRAVACSTADFVYIPGEFLQARGLEQNALFAWWTPDDDPETRCAWDVDSSKAIAAGLTFRPLEETIQDTLEWDASRPADAPRRVTLEPERERELLDAWRQA